MGLTMECAQCHDHKYDQFAGGIFSIHAFYNNNADPGMQTDTAPMLEIVTPTGKTTG